LLAPLFLTGCMGSMMKRAEMHQQALQEISSALAYEAFVPMESSFRSAPAEELSPGVYKVLNADKIEPKKTFRPTALEDSLVVARMSDPRQFEKVKNIDKKKLDMVFPRGALVTVLYLKNLKTGTYFNLHPEGFSVDSWEVSPEGKFLAYIQDHGLYLQNLAGESLRKLIFSGAVALPAQTGRIFAQSSFDAVYKFSPDGKYLAYIDPLKGLFLLSLQEPYQAPLDANEN